MKSPELIKAEKAEATLEQASELIQLITQVALLTSWLSHSQATMETKA